MKFVLYIMVFMDMTVVLMMELVKITPEMDSFNLDQVTVGAMALLLLMVQIYHATLVMMATVQVTVKVLVKVLQ